MATRDAGTPGLFDKVGDWYAKRADRPKRVRRVAAMRKAGKSLRAIATACRISLRQVQLDLRKALEMGLDIEPDGGAVVGLDKRRQPASRPRKQGMPSGGGTVAGLLDELAVIVADGRKVAGKPMAAAIRQLAERVAATATAMTKLAEGLGR